jgi:hypothetical protein
VVLVEMLSVAIVSMIILATSYHWYEFTMLDLVRRITSNNRNLVIFMLSILIVPIILLFL